MAVWVCPHCPKKSAEKEIEKIQGLNRLYAFPCEPKFINSSLVILDSGAFGLSQSGGKINFKYMQRLSEHYEKYYRKNVLCVAPDEFANPEQSMMNFQKWHKNKLFSHISPVLQCERKNEINIDSLKFQADFYREKADTIFFSNAFLYGRHSKILKVEKVFEYCKQIGFEWVHCLGAGWDIEDVKIWAQMNCLDSFDSIAYYTTKDIDTFGSLNPVENVKEIIKCIRELRE